MDLIDVSHIELKEHDVVIIRVPEEHKGRGMVVANALLERAVKKGLTKCLVLLSTPALEVEHLDRAAMAEHGWIRLAE